MRRHLNLHRVLLTLSAVVGAATMAATVPAEAATIHNGKSYGSVKSGQPYDWIEACDEDRDGHGGYVEYWTDYGNHGTVWDGNGSSMDCGNAKIYHPDHVTSFRVCVDKSSGPACSAVVKL